MSAPQTLPRAAARFLMVGAVGLGTDAACFALASAAGGRDAAARAASLLLATLVTWALNRRFTFGASARRAAVEASRYALVAAGAQGFNYALFLTLRATAPALPALAALVSSAAAAAAFSFCGQRFFTFAALGSPAPRSAAARP